MKKLAILILTIFMVSQALASVAYVNEYWDITEDLSAGTITGEDVNQMVHDSTFVLRIRTSQNAYCRYSTTSGISFYDMTESFDDNLETIHKKTFSGFTSSRVNRYYIRCIPIDYKNNGTIYSGPSGELEATVKIDPAISARIELEKDILSEGTHEIKLETTKIPSNIPELTYSYDGGSASSIVLSGSGTGYTGYITIPKSSGEKTGTFEFSATDLEGVSGESIISGATFEVDTKPPSTITNLEVVGEYKKIRLDWIMDEENIEEINIYRSTNPGVTLSDLYKTIDSDEEDYTDTSVKKGKTYYYRISSTDTAGNVADLSIESSASIRLDNSSTSSDGLDSSLISIVDSMLTEIDLLQGDISRAKDSVNSKEDENELIKIADLSSGISSATSELSAIEKEVVSYKLQDLSEDTLNSRINAARVKLSVIKRKIPNSISSIDSSSKDITISEDDIRTLLVEYSPELSPSQMNKIVKKSSKLLEESGIKISSEIEVIEITYLDGSQEPISIIKHNLDSTLEKSAEDTVLLKIPISVDFDKMKMKNSNYVEERGGLFSFGTDTKSISYVVESELDTQVLNDILLSVIRDENSQMSITGNAISGISGASVFGIVILVLLAGGLVTYLMFMKKRGSSDEKSNVDSFLTKAKEVKDMQKSGMNSEANKLYESLKVDYLSLSKSEKSKVFNKVKELHK